MLRLLVLALLLHGGNDAAVCSFELTAKSQLVVIDWKGTCHRSDDAGRTWADSPAIWMRKTLTASDQEIWGITANELNERVACSLNGGKDWTSVVLESGTFHPMAFVGVRNGCPMLVDQLGQVRQWKRSERPKSDGSDWVPLGVPVPISSDHASSGCLVDETLYVGSQGRIWWSTDMGKKWNFFDCKMKSPVVEFAVSSSSCWAATRDGVVFHAARGKQNWTRVVTIPDVFFVFSMATADNLLVVVGEQEPKPFVVTIQPTGKMTMLTRPAGKQAYRVCIEEDGSYLVATDAGLFRTMGNEWTTVWPAN
jgi:photosystem II stability/assembly factor-like uncharacterized protein